MAEVILKCDGTDPVYEPDWDAIVGQKTLLDGGHVGDLLTITRAHLEDAKANGELREEDAGNAYAQAIMHSVTEAIKFELEQPKAALELCYLQAQADKLRCDCDNDTLRTTSQIELNDAQIAKLECDCDNDTLKTASQIKLNTAQETKLECDCTNDTDRTASTIALNAANENKLACDCCNNSKATESKLLVDEAQIDKLICDCCNSTTSTNSKVSLDRAQEEKLLCDCTNQTNDTTAKVALTNKQIAGIEYNARQKLLDAQLTAWAVVFSDTDLETIPSTLNENSIDNSYQTIKNYLATT